MNILGTSRLGLALTLALATSAAVLADAKSELIAAAKKLGEAKNYSWTSTVDLEGMPFRPGPTEGKWTKDGFMWVSAEMMGNKSEAYLLGTNGVTQVEGEWKTEAELPQFGGPGGPGPRPEAGGGERPPGGGGGERPNAGGPGGGRRGFASMGGRRLLTTKAPHEMAMMFAEKAKDLKAADGSITGELPEELARELASFGRRPRGGGAGGPGGPGGFGPSNAKGWIKVKLTDGQITKAILEIESEMRAPDGGTQTINSITTTEIKNLGTTQIDVPAGVKAKLAKAEK